MTKKEQAALQRLYAKGVLPLGALNASYTPQITKIMTKKELELKVKELENEVYLWKEYVSLLTPEDIDLPVLEIKISSLPHPELGKYSYLMEKIKL